MNYATDIVARREMIWCALQAHGSHVKDPIAYVNRKMKKFGPLLKDAVGYAYEFINTDCLAVCEDKIDAKLSAEHGWETIQAIRARDLEAASGSGGKMTYRTKFLDPDYRRQPKTNHYCIRCQRDIQPGSEVRWVAFELDHPESVIHPDDLAKAWEHIRPRRAPHHHNHCIQFEPIGSECVKKIGREWTMVDELTAPPS